MEKKGNNKKHEGFSLAAMDKADTYKLGSHDDDRVACLMPAHHFLLVGYLFNIRNGRI